VFAAVCLTFVVVVVGAYVRLQDAGLGCPDWPGCYGHLVGVPQDAEEIERAEQGFPQRRVESHKAWKEMFHRYIAGTLGLLICAIMMISWLKKSALRQSPWLPTAIVALVALQATLGMWTVTMLLKPVIVTLHLLGGMATLALLSWLALRQIALPPTMAGAQRLRPWAIVGLVIVICQITLGGWVSTNYAALICRDFPTCHGAWLPAMDFGHGFQIARELGMTAAGAPLTLDALTAIHWTHRAGALVTFLYIGGQDIALEPLNDDSDESYAPIAYLADTGGEPGAVLEHAQEERIKSEGLNHAMASLDPRSRRIIEARWLRESDQATLHDLAAEFGVSAERIRQIEHKAMQKMRGAMGAQA